MERFVKMLLSSVYGTIIGTIIAFAVNRWFWWVGMISGGLMGYLLYEWLKVIRAAGALLSRGRDWRMIRQKAAFSTILLFGSMTWISPVYIWAVYSEDRFGRGSIMAALLIVPPALLGVVIALVSVVSVALVWGEDGDDVKEDEILGLGKDAASLVFPVVVLWHLPRGIYWLVMRAPKAAMALARFAWRLFIIIHSEERLIVGLSAVLGTVGGYFDRSVPVGIGVAVVFVALGKFLVADRWLKPRGYLRI